MANVQQISSGKKENKKVIKYILKIVKVGLNNISQYWVQLLITL